MARAVGGDGVCGAIESACSMSDMLSSTPKLGSSLGRVVARIIWPRGALVWRAVGECDRGERSLVGASNVHLIDEEKGGADERRVFGFVPTAPSGCVALSAPQVASRPPLR